MANYTATTTIITPTESLSATKSGQYSEIFNIKQEVDNTDGFITISINTAVMGANSLRDAKVVILKNSGNVGAEVQIAREAWAAATPDTNGAVDYTSHLLAAGEYMFLSNLRQVGYDGNTSSANGASLTDLAPTSNLYLDSGANTGEAVEDSSTDFDVTDGDFFKVGDLIQLGINATTATLKEILRVTAISTNNLTVERGLYGTVAVDKDAQTNGTNGATSGSNVHFPIFNIYADHDKYATVQTDASGRFGCMNFFGYGRYADKVGDGIVAGSISGKFYSAGFQELGMSGISAATESGLASSTAYAIDISVDGGSDHTLAFTTSTNTKFGGSDGILQKIQDALDVQTYTTSSNILDKKVTVGIVRGDIRFTSGQHLSTSAISVSAPASGTTIFAVGRFSMAVGDIEDAVAARLPDDVIYDKRSNISIPNVSQMFYDDVHGNISGTCKGTVNYETGAIDLQGCPPNANFVVSANYGSAHAGGNQFSSTLGNCIARIEARSVNQKVNTTIELLGLK